MDSRYSLRFFSKKMGLSETYLKRIVNGNRALTAQKAFLLAKVFGFSASERNYLVTLCLRDGSKSKGEKQYFQSLIDNLLHSDITYDDQKTFRSLPAPQNIWTRSGSKPVAILIRSASS